LTTVLHKVASGKGYMNWVRRRWFRWAISIRPPDNSNVYYDWRKRNPAWHIHLQYWLIMYRLVQDGLDPRKHIQTSIRFMSPIEYLLTATIHSVHAI